MNFYRSTQTSPLSRGPNAGLSPWAGGSPAIQTQVAPSMWTVVLLALIAAPYVLWVATFAFVMLAFD
jgi:hypothetical protein